MLTNTLSRLGNLASRPIFQSVLVAAIFFGLAIPFATAQTKKPNILIILADDLGYSDVSPYGGEIQTPNLQKLAEQGLRFSQFYNTGRCWPTRASLLTGFYAQGVRRDTINGMRSGGRGTRPEWAKLIPKFLQTANYRSYHTGKWHLDGMPIESGFDRSYYLKDQGRFFNPKLHWLDDQKLPPVAPESDFYATKRLADHAVEVLQEHNEKHSDQPFFHYLAFTAPHFPLHALPEDIALYDKTYLNGWDAVRAARWQRMQGMGLIPKSQAKRASAPERNLGPPYHFEQAFEILGEDELNRPIPWNKLSEPQQAFQAKKMAIHAAMIHRLDLELGRVFQQIRDMGEWDNTLVIFLSDNGASAEIMVRDDGHDPDAAPGSANSYLCLGPGWSTVSNTPFRRHKTWTHEGGIATPMIVSWPDKIAESNSIHHAPGHVIDIVPTILDVAGVVRPDSLPNLPGHSLLPILLGKEIPERDCLWWYHDGHRAIQVGNWKAVAPIAEPWELYDLSSDRIESNDLFLTEHDRLQGLVDRWEEVLDSQVRLATSNLDPEKQQQALELARVMQSPSAVQEQARPKRTQVLLQGETFQLNGRHAFMMVPKPETLAAEQDKPWIFYGPTLPGVPDSAESWMHQKFLDAGVAVAGIDVGEAYGSPHAIRHFEALHEHMVSQGYSKTPALLGRSRGGLWASSFAIAHPEWVAGLGGIYPVYDYTTYPGTKRAASAYGVTADELETRQDEFNPIKRISHLIEARIPVCIIHGTDDKVVPIEPNSGTLEQAYQDQGVGDLVQLIRAKGQGHSFWEGFFHCQELVDFLIVQAQK